MKKERIPIARFLCRKQQRTFSLLPIQLVPYFQYTVHAVMATLLLGLEFWQTGPRGFYSASITVDQDSLVTPFLVVCWLTVIVRGFRRAHAALGRIYDLNDVFSTPTSSVAWPEAGSYFLAFGCNPKTSWWPQFQTLINRYSHSTGQFLFGKPSQQRAGPA